MCNKAVSCFVNIGGPELGDRDVFTPLAQCDVQNCKPNLDDAVSTLAVWDESREFMCLGCLLSFFQGAGLNYIQLIKYIYNKNIDCNSLRE